MQECLIGELGKCQVSQLGDHHHPETSPPQPLPWGPEELARESQDGSPGGWLAFLKAALCLESHPWLTLPPQHLLLASSGLSDLALPAAQEE